MRPLRAQPPRLVLARVLHVSLLVMSASIVSFQFPVASFQLSFVLQSCDSAGSWELDSWKLHYTNNEETDVSS